MAIRSSFILDIIFLSIILLVFYFLFLGSYPLFTPDEGRYSEVAREMIATGDYITPRVNGVAFLDKPVLYYWLQAAAIKLFGIQEWALRFFPAIFGIFGCIITYICGRKLFDRRTGLISALVLATTPLYFCAAHYANLDLEVAVLISCSLLFFMTGIQTAGRSRHYFLFLAYLFSALAFLTKGLIGIVFPAMIGGLWIIFLSQWRLLAKIHLLKGLILFAMIVLPWYYFVQKANPQFLHYFFVEQQVTRFLSTATFNNPTPLWFYLPIILIGFFPWTSFLVQAFANTIRLVFKSGLAHQTELFLLIWTIVVFLFFSIPHSKMVTYILPIFPALSLLVGKYLSSAWENTKSPGMVIGMICMILLCIVFACLVFFIPEKFTQHLEIIAVIFIVQALFLLTCIRKKKLLPAFIITMICTMAFLLALTNGANYLNQNSAKSLVITLKKVMKPDEEVIHYFKFFQDVPIYLEKNVIIVADWTSAKIPYRDNWQRELWYGMPFQDTSSILIDENTFWQKWQGRKRVFVFLGENYLDQFKTHTKKYYVIGEENGILLISNQTRSP